MYPPINPVLFQLGPFSLHWYGITMTLAILLGTWVTSRYVTRRGEDGNHVWDMLLWVLIPAIIGARLYYVFIQSPRSGPNGIGSYLADPIKIVQIWQGGIHIYGALIFGALALLLYLRVHKLPYLVYLDGAALGLALGQVIGRLGNFINQELYGPPTTLPWGLRIDANHRIPPYDNMDQYPDSVRFQPLFLYEMLWDAIGFALLLWVARRFEKRLLKGDLFLLYAIWIPLGRFFIEFMRTDSWFFPGTPFNVVHILIALLVIGSATVLILRHRNRPAVQTALDESNSDTDVIDESKPALQQEDEATNTVTQNETALDEAETSPSTTVAEETPPSTSEVEETLPPASTVEEILPLTKPAEETPVSTSTAEETLPHAGTNEEKSLPGIEKA